MLEAHKQLIRLADQAQVLIALFDNADRLRFANSAFRSAFAVLPNEEPTWAQIMRRNHQARRGTVITATDFETWLIQTQTRRGKSRAKSYETDLHDGRWLLMTETVQDDGWMLCIASDITGLRSDERSVRQDRDFALKAAQTDELTGIANRRYVTGRLTEILAQTGLVGTSLGCVCILDIDHFKRINDTHGHSGGDIVLRDFAHQILKLLRRNDSFGRIGGEEFMLVLPGATLHEAELIVQRMLFTIRRTRPLGTGSTLSYSFSAGIAQCRVGDLVDDVYSRADGALYASKSSGRDRITLASS